MKDNNAVKLIVKYRDYLLLTLLVILSIPLILPYAKAGYFPTHDGEWAVMRLADMFRTLRDLQFPARYSGNLNFGYGYPLFNFAYPFPYYFAMIFHFLKFDFVESIKITFAITIPISAIGMYLLSKRLWSSSLGAFASSILYIYLPYRMVDLYVRGSIGESIAFAVAPFLFLALFNVYKTSSPAWMVLTSILYAILITTHNIMAVLLSIPLTVLFIFLVFQNKKILKIMLLSAVCGVLLSSFFTLPALLEKGNILLSKIPIADRSIYYVEPIQLLTSPWGYGVPADKTGAFTYQIGITQLVILVFVIGFLLYDLIRKKWKLDFTTKLACVFILTTLALSLLLFSWSNLIWENTPLLSEINYPWILIGVLGFLISVLCGFIFSNRITTAAAFLISLSAIYFVLPNAHPQMYVDRGDNYYVTNDATTTSSNELTPLWVESMPTVRPSEKVRVIRGNGKVNDIISNSKEIKFKFNSKTPAVVEIATIYYPGWKAYSNGNEKAIFYDNPQGIMNVKLNSGSQEVKLQFTETPIRLFSNILSLATFCGLIFVLIKYRKVKV